MQTFLLASLLAAPAVPDFSAIRPTLEPISNEDVAKANKVSGLQNRFWVSPTRAANAAWPGSTGAASATASATRTAAS